MKDKIIRLTIEHLKKKKVFGFPWTRLPPN